MVSFVHSVAAFVHSVATFVHTQRSTRNANTWFVVTKTASLLIQYMLYQWTIQTIHNSSSLCYAQTEELPCHKPPHLELKRGKPYDRQPTGRAPLEVFSVVLLIISSRSRLWKRRFEQRSEEERDADQRRKDKTPNSRLMETVALLLSSLSRDGENA